jgi:hypothetical protein
VLGVDEDSVKAAPLRSITVSPTKGEGMTVREIMAVHPRPSPLDRDVLVRCIEECLDCGAVCTSCADACLAEPDVPELVSCIRFCLDCADACRAAGSVLTRQTEAAPEVVRAITQACAVACRASGDECERHAAHHDHCRICEGVCRRCEQACNEVLAAIAAHAG